MAAPVVLLPLCRPGTAPVRIDWFGDVAYSARQGGQSPRISVTVSRAIDGNWIRELEPDQSTPVSIPVPIAFLRLLQIGDIWVQGQRVGRDSRSIRLTLPDVLIDETTTEIRPAGLPFEDAHGQHNYLLPFSEFDAHRGHTGAFCAHVRVQDDFDLIVPCMELIRFYFGSSSALLGRLFSGGFKASSLYELARCNALTGVANITLAQGLPSLAADAIARIAFDEEAERAAARISKSGTAAIANRERFYPKTTFPFVGKTDLTVDGRWIHPNGTQVFLAERLVQCTHPFPFKRLYVQTSEDAGGGRRTAGSASTSRKVNAKRQAQPDKALTDEYVARTLRSIRIAADEDEENPFPDLKNKSIIHLASAAASGSAKPRSEEPDRLAAGEHSSSSKTRGAEVAACSQPPIQAESEPALIRQFRVAYGEMLDVGWTAASLLPPVAAKCGCERCGPFLRGDWLLDRTDSSAIESWFAKIGPRGSSNAELLVLMRSGVPTADISLVPIQNSANETEALTRCIEFVDQGLQREAVVASLKLDPCEDGNAVAQIVAFLKVGLSAGNRGPFIGSEEVHDPR